MKSRDSLDYLTNKLNGKESLLETAQRTKDQERLNQYYQSALKHLQKQAKESELEVKNELGIDAAQVDSTQNQRTILFWAIACFQPKETLEKLFELGSEAQERYFIDGKPLSAIYAAITFNNVTAIEALCKKDEAIAYQAHVQTGQLPANFATEKNKLDALQALLTINKDLAITGAGVSSITPLHTAVLCNNADATQVIASSNKVACNTPNAKGRTPLHIAAAKGYDNIIRVLLDGKRSDIDITTNADDDSFPSQTALQIAANSGHNEATRLLLRQKVLVDNNENPDPNHTIGYGKLNCHIKTAFRLLKYLNNRLAEDQHTGNFSKLMKNVTSYQFAYNKSQKLDVARHILKNILKNVGNPLEGLTQEQKDIAQDSRLGKATYALFGKSSQTHSPYSSDSERDSPRSSDEHNSNNNHSYR